MGEADWKEGRKEGEERRTGGSYTEDLEGDYVSVRDVLSEEVTFELRPEYQDSPLGKLSEEECAGRREQHVQRSQTEASVAGGEQARGIRV